MASNNWTNTTINSTDWSGDSRNSTNWTGGSLNSTNWDNDGTSEGNILLENGSSVLLETGEIMTLQ